MTANENFNNRIYFRVLIEIGTVNNPQRYLNLEDNMIFCAALNT